MLPADRFNDHAFVLTAALEASNELVRFVDFLPVREGAHFALDELWLWLPLLPSCMPWKRRAVSCPQLCAVVCSFPSPAAAGQLLLVLTGTAWHRCHRRSMLPTCGR